MSTSHKNFGELEEISAINFVSYLNQTTARQIIYLGGIANADQLSDHLLSRKNVEDILKKVPLPRLPFFGQPSLSAQEAPRLKL